MVSKRLHARVLEHEGFRTKPYLDSLGISTIGHGLTYLTEKESSLIVLGRLEYLEQRLEEQLNFWPALKDEVQEVLTEMAFQLGQRGLLNFKKMLFALSVNNVENAAAEMIDSKWANQTPTRAAALAAIVRNSK